jgi:hypothetical protein
MKEIFGILHPQFDYEELTKKFDIDLENAIANENLEAGFGRQIRAEDFERIMKGKDNDE